MLTADDFRVSDDFADQPEEHLAWLAEHAEEMHIAKGEQPFYAGDAADHMIVVLDGAMQVVVTENGQRRVFGTMRTGRVTGLLPYSRMTHYAGEGFAVEDTRFALVHRDLFPEMLHRMPEVGKRLVAAMSDRVRESARGEQQREKLMALGKLSAGLAHELNNPAAAVRRAADTMRARLDRLPTLVAKLAEHQLSYAQVCAVDRLREAAARHAQEDQPMTTLERGEREDELADWLDACGVEDSYVLAETFADAGLTPDDLEAITAGVPEEAACALIVWLEGSLAADRIADEIEGAATRISDLVASVKAYSHMDQAPDKQPVDVRRGIKSTLTMLGHQLKRKDIQVEKAFDDDLPAVPALPGELNQVWTNLVDNAVDAMGEGGTLRIEAETQARGICVRIIDDGTGIPDDALPRVFEPFYTTKDVGAGTGLGLDIVRRIVEEQHGGSVTVESAPGRTAFSVFLPTEAVEVA